MRNRQKESNSAEAGSSSVPAAAVPPSGCQVMEDFARSPPLRPGQGHHFRDPSSRGRPRRKKIKGAIEDVLFRSMSSAIPVDKGSAPDDIMWHLVKNNEFLQYEQSIEQIKPSRFDFTDVTKHTDDDISFSNSGIEVIRDYLHIGLVSENFVNGKEKCSRVLLLVWPNFVAPGAYQNYKLHLVDIKKIKTLVFRVPDAVFRKYSEGNSKLHEIVAATAMLTPVEEWKLLERTVISSFYHFTFDKATSDIHGDIQVWKNFPKENLNKEWKQLLFICCGPQGLAYLVKRMLKRNWARIARNSISIDVRNDGYSVFCTGGVVKLIVEWAKQFFKPDRVVKYLEEINSIKPVLSAREKVEKSNASFSQCGNYPYHCKYCGKPFLALSRMKYHVSLHEKKRNVKFQCYKCSFSAKDETGFMLHVHAKDPTFNCTLCFKKHDSESALLTHLQNHEKNKPFNCHICGKCFLLEHNLRSHYDTHSDSRPMFSCHICNKTTISITSLRIHMANKHDEE